VELVSGPSQGQVSKIRYKETEHSGSAWFETTNLSAGNVTNPVIINDGVPGLEPLMKFDFVALIAAGTSLFITLGVEGYLD